MIRGREAGIYAVAVTGSMVLHVCLLGGLSSAAQRAPRERARVLEFAVVEPPPPPPPPESEPDPEPEPEPPEPEPVDLTEVELPEDPVAPPPNADDGEAEPEESKPVFGVSMSSVVGPGSGGFRVRVGNTLMKEADEELTPPEEVDSYAPVPLHEVTKRPRYENGPCQADYPAEAKRLGIEGRVELEVEVRADGTVGQVKVVKGLGYGLDAAAVMAVKSCPFIPGEIAGRKVTTFIHIPYLFILED